ncbi:hypothetical protein EYF80_027016 [Liparis tanakae]|uniref:Uncharacterized protein n=1 Tax=Liparis tanakae TaxID=230148 RepID=A0A4Z2HB95_9TELE|nr:hypothetical protein EYF80_027016 [Liparis tanakae]
MARGLRRCSTECTLPSSIILPAGAVLNTGYCPPSVGSIPDVEDLHCLHNVFVHINLWLRPVHCDLVTPQLNTSGHQLPASHGSRTDLLPLFGLGDATNEKTAVVHRGADPQQSPGPHLIVVELTYRPLGLVFLCVHHKCVPSVLPVKVHHQPHLIDASDRLEHRHQLILVNVPWDLAHKDFTSPWRRRSIPTRRRAIFTLTIFLDHTVADFPNFLSVDQC